MPFKSEAQRRYMHANLPEIAQRWEQEYSTGGIASQGGMKNYLGEQPMVNAPKYWQSAPDHEMTELAYITPRERDVLVDMNMYGSMQGSPNEGPSGIMSLNGHGSNDPSQNVGGGDISSAETGGDRHGMSDKDASEFRSAAINAGAGQRVNPGFFDSKHVISPEELAAAKAYRSQDSYAGDLARGAWNQTRGSGLGSFISGGGIFGNLIRGVGQKLGWGKQWNEPTYDMSGYSGLGPEGITPTAQGDYDIYGNKINEITGEVTSPEGKSLGFLPGYPGQKSGITTIPTGDGGSDDYSKLVEQYIVPTESDVELNDGGFEWRFGQNRTPEEKEAIEKAMMEKFSGDEWDWNSFGLGDMDG